MPKKGEERLGPRRRPESGGYARGDEKRIRIIEAGIRRFGEDGYEGASTRQIAQEAGVNPPALQYYFGSKEGLYFACLQHIGQAFSLTMQEVYSRAEHVADTDAAAAVELFCDLLDALAEFLFETAETPGWRRLDARVKGERGQGVVDDAAANRIERELFDHCFRLTAIATGGSPSSVETKLRAHAAMGTLAAFHLDMSNVLARLGWPDLRGPRLAQLKILIRRQAKAALTPLQPGDLQ